jgi:hypothetical protein
VKSIQYLLLLVVALDFSTPAFPQNLRDQYKAPFEGPILKDAFKKRHDVSLRQHLAGSTGIYPESGGRQIISEFNQQGKPAVWHLLIEKKTHWL